MASYKLSPRKFFISSRIFLDHDSNIKSRSHSPSISPMNTQISNRNTRGMRLNQLTCIIRTYHGMFLWYPLSMDQTLRHIAVNVCRTISHYLSLSEVDSESDYYWILWIDILWFPVTSRIRLEARNLVTRRQPIRAEVFYVPFISHGRENAITGSKTIGLKSVLIGSLSSIIMEIEHLGGTEVKLLGWGRSIITVIYLQRLSFIRSFIRRFI